MIKLENVTLDFPVLPGSPRNSRSGMRSNQATGGIVNSTRSGGISVRALEDVSFSLQPGDKLALLGHNGAGKTTLLRVIAGLYSPTKGLVHAEGRIAPLLNLSFGMDMEATGYDNIWVRGLFLGMSRMEIKSKIDAIAQFSELGNFLHLPMRTYSSGMRARLAFAVSTHVDADVLLLDEVVATGDASFFQKAHQQLETITGTSRIMVLASHSNKVLRELCNKGLLLEHGKVKAFGLLDDVIATYKSKRNVRLHKGADEGGMEGRYASLDHQSNINIKKVLLVNDTGMLSNPGCRAVRKAYKLLFHKYLRGTAITGSIPVNYWIEHFRDLAVRGKCAIRRDPNAFAVAAETVADIDIDQWERVRKTLVEADLDLQEMLGASDLVVINGEGSIHHNSVRALALLALAKTAVEAGKKVMLLNATVQQMMPALLQEIFPHFALIQVREAASKEFLRQIGVKSIAGVDLAFLALDDESEARTRLLDASAYILVTGGVTVDKESLNQLFNSVENCGFRPVYLSIGDGGETELAQEVCSKRNIPLVEAGKLGVKELIGFLRQFPLAISGRHHMNIFLMRAGIPFVPLNSNTWKIEETLQSVGYPLAPVKTYSDLLPIVDHALQNRVQLAAASTQSYLNGKSLLDPFLKQLTSCIS